MKTKVKKKKKKGGAVRLACLPACPSLFILIASELK